MKNGFKPSKRAGTALHKVLVYCAALLAFAASFGSDAALAGGSPDDALGPAMSLMNEKKFSEAKKLLREALRKDPSSELLWVSYDSCVRSEMLSGAEVHSTDGASAREPGRDRAPLFPAEGASGETPEVKVAAAAEGGSAEKYPAAEVSVSDIDCSILEADFSKGSASGDLACLLNDTFKFIAADGVSYLMAGAKGRGASVSFTFNISRFPKKVKLIFTHRLVKKDRFLSDAPVVIEVNEKKINYDAVKLGNRLEATEFDVTNAAKEGANIITLNAEDPKFPYLLKNVKVMLYFRD